MPTFVFRNAYERNPDPEENWEIDLAQQMIFHERTPIDSLSDAEKTIVLAAYEKGFTFEEKMEELLKLAEGIYFPGLEECLNILRDGWEEGVAESNEEGEEAFWTSAILGDTVGASHGGEATPISVKTGRIFRETISFKRLPHTERIIYTIQSVEYVQKRSFTAEDLSSSSAKRPRVNYYAEMRAAEGSYTQMSSAREYDYAMEERNFTSLEKRKVWQSVDTHGMTFGAKFYRMLDRCLANDLEIMPGLYEIEEILRESSNIQTIDSGKYLDSESESQSSD
ncbi:hypothetical protein IWZ03DRAFT_433969 [Phyllosticta citriasiana]|uniref:Uncharacterized protein n=1 Tax=Phyllosticta citriasiana TaxID=595635 RepID=A0ABR1K866_9PEZI